MKKIYLAFLSMFLFTPLFAVDYPETIEEYFTKTTKAFEDMNRETEKHLNDIKKSLAETHLNDIKKSLAETQQPETKKEHRSPLVTTFGEKKFIELDDAIGTQNFLRELCKSYEEQMICYKEFIKEINKLKQSCQSYKNNGINLITFLEEMLSFREEIKKANDGALHNLNYPLFLVEKQTKLPLSNNETVLAANNLNYLNPNYEQTRKLGQHLVDKYTKPLDTSIFKQITQVKKHTIFAFCAISPQGLIETNESLYFAVSIFDYKINLDTLEGKILTEEYFGYYPQKLEVINSFYKSLYNNDLITKNITKDSRSNKN